jgi:hypothetical protein
MYVLLTVLENASPVVVAVSVLPVAATVWFTEPNVANPAVGVADGCDEGVPSEVIEIEVVKSKSLRPYKS